MCAFNTDARDKNFATTDLDKRAPNGPLMKKGMGLFNDELRDQDGVINRGYTRMMVLKDAVGAGEQRFRTGMYHQFDIEGNDADYCFDWWRKDSKLVKWLKPQLDLCLRGRGRPKGGGSGGGRGGAGRGGGKGSGRGGGSGRGSAGTGRGNGGGARRSVGFVADANNPDGDGEEVDDDPESESDEDADDL